MKSKIIDGRLCCIFSEFEARILRQLLGSVKANGQASSATYKTSMAMGEELSLKDVWYTGDNCTKGYIELQPGVDAKIYSNIEVTGWNS